MLPDHTERSQMSLVSEVEREEIVRRIEKLRKKGARHLLWALLGVSPGALLPALGLMWEGSVELLLVLGVLVTLTQFYAWAKTGREAGDLRERLDRTD